MPLLLVGLLTLASPSVAVQLEGGAAHFVAAPQSTYFGFGEALSLRGDLGLWGPLSAQLSGTFVNVAPQAAFLTGPGRVLEAGAGLKVRPLKWLWLDAQVLLIGTGSLVRFGYELGAGASFAVTDLFALGPYVRWLQVVTPDAPGVDGSDALMLHAGLALTLRFGGGAEPAVVQKPVEPAPAPPPPELARPEPASPQRRPDADGDGIPDARDQCPEEPEVFNGVDDEDGCPDPKAGPAIVKLNAGTVEVVPPVRYDRVGHVDAASLTVVVTLARVLALHPELGRVRITVWDSSIELASKRAKAVVDVLVEVGLSRERLDADGEVGKSHLDVRALGP